MKQPDKSDLDSNDPVLRLLSREEAARVSADEGKAELADGDDYIDRAAPENGVRRVHGSMQRTTGKILPRSAVSASTWARIAERFGTRFIPKSGK